MRLNVTFAITPIMMMLCATASGQNYPTHEIRVICGLPAGSGGDIVTRFYADQLSKLAGKPVIVENRAGMIMSAGAEAVAKAPPDGYTILITSVTSSHAANVFNFTKLPYDPVKDFAPIAMLQQSYFILMVRPEAPWKNVNELTQAMRIKGEKGSYGYGAPPALASAELYKARKGLKTEGIAYKTSLQSLSEMASGVLDFQFFDSNAGTGLLESGKLRGLAITTAKRIAGVDLPTMAEAAEIEEFDIAPVWGALAPARTPAPIIGKLEGWFMQINQLEATRRFLSITHAAQRAGDAKALADFIPKEIEKWRELSKLANIQPQ